MSFTFACGTCGKSSTVDNKFAGQEGQCDQCGEVIPILGTTAAPVASCDLEPKIAATGRPAAASAREIRENPSGFARSSPAGQALPPGSYRLPASRRQASARGPANPARSRLGVFLGFLILIGLGGIGIFLQQSSARGAGRTSRSELEAILRERVNLHQQLVHVLEGVHDLKSARDASPLANQSFRAITVNLRKMRTVKGREDDLDALKQQYEANQLRAFKAIVQQNLRVSKIRGAREALNVAEAVYELDREEKSITSIAAAQPSRAPAPSPVAQTQVVNPGPKPGANRQPNPDSNRSEPTHRQSAARPDAPGPG